MGELTIQHSVTIARPVMEVLEVLRDIDHQSTWWPGQYLSEALEFDADGLVARSRIGNDIKIAKEEFEVVYTHSPGTTGYSWVLDGSTIAQKAQHGSWTLTELSEESTEVTLDLAVDPLLPLPGFLLRKVIGDALKDAVLALKAHCESLPA